MFIKIGGVPGVGKTTIITEVTEASRSLGLPIQRIKGGDILMEILGVRTYDELRAIPEAIREAARPEMFRRMYDLDRQNPEIIRLRDAHFSLWQEETGFSYFPLQDGDCNQTLALVCVVATPELIMVRRQNENHSRCDRQCRETVIRSELEMEIATAKSQADSLSRKLVVVENTTNVEEACLQLVRGAFVDTPHKAVLEGHYLAALYGKERR